MAERRKVVVTGIGAITPLGLDEATFWRNMLSGVCGVRTIRSFDTKDYKTTVGGEVDSEALLALLQARGMVSSDRTVDMALLASVQALEQAGMLRGGPPYSPAEIATIFGTGAGASHSLYNTFTSFSQKGVRGMRPTSVPRCMANSITAQISMKFRLTGPNYVIVSACTSSTVAIGIAFRMIRDGYADKVLCGGADAAFDPFVFGGWNNLGVMSRNPDPARACRPFDSARDGCVLGEGAGALLLESLDSAVARSAHIRAEICGYGESSDAEHMTSPSAEGQARCMKDALASAGITPDQIGFINAHGTGTRANDECESRSIRMALGKAADGIPVGANKSFFGHLLGACGVIEFIATILGLENRKVPPNLNLDNPDPACSLQLVGKNAMELASPVAMKNSFGFGGNNTVLIAKRWEG